MEVVIQEGLNGTVFDDIDSWEIVSLAVTSSFVIKLYQNNKLKGQAPFNPKTTILVFNYDGGYAPDNFDNPPKGNKKH